MIVDRWFTAEYIQEHESHRNRALQARGPTHHQGSRSLSAYKQAWSASHSGQSVSTFMAYGLARKGKATSSATFSPDDPPESYSNPNAYTRISSYASEAWSVQGPDWDPSTDDIDGPIVMRIGQGKKHGRYGLAMAASTPALFPASPRSGHRPRPRPGHMPTVVPFIAAGRCTLAENERMAQELRDLAARTEQAERERQPSGPSGKGRPSSWWRLWRTCTTLATSPVYNRRNSLHRRKFSLARLRRRVRITHLRRKQVTVLFLHQALSFHLCSSLFIFFIT